MVFCSRFTCFLAHKVRYPKYLCFGHRFYSVLLHTPHVSTVHVMVYGGDPSLFEKTHKRKLTKNETLLYYTTPFSVDLGVLQVPYNCTWGLNS